MKKGKGGRPSKFTEEIVQKLIRAIRAGNCIEVACKYAGIHVATFYRWLEKGEKSRHGKFCDFARQIKEVLAEAEIVAVAKIKQSEDWRAQAWWLERKFPERWGKKEYLNIDQKVSKREEINFDEETRVLIEKLTNKLLRNDEREDTES